MRGGSVGVVFQDPSAALNPLMSTGEQIAEAVPASVRGGRRRERVAELIAEVGLGSVPGMVRRYPHELSGGQCQRVLIAMAFAGEPALVVADEPTTALDVMTQAHIVRLIAEQQKLHRTALLFITHDLRLAGHVCRNVGVMYAGDMVEFGPAFAVLKAPSHPYTKSLLAANPDLTGPRRVLPALSELSRRIERNFRISNWRLPTPTRTCRKNTGPRLSNLISSATKSIRGARITRATIDTTMSKARFCSLLVRLSGPRDRTSVSSLP